MEGQISLTSFRGTRGVATSVLNIVVDGKITTKKYILCKTTLLSIKDMSIVCRYTYFNSLLITENIEEIVEEKKEVENIRY